MLQSASVLAMSMPAHEPYFAKAALCFAWYLVLASSVLKHMRFPATLPWKRAGNSAPACSQGTTAPRETSSASTPAGGAACASNLFS